jgi:hypothetical protein
LTPISIDLSYGCCIPSKSDEVNDSENDIEDALDLTFSTEDDRFGEVVTVDLKPDGQNIVVTNENKKEYVEYVPYPLSLYKRLPTVPFPQSTFPNPLSIPQSTSYSSLSFLS